MEKTISIALIAVMLLAIFAVPFALAEETDDVSEVPMLISANEVSEEIESELELDEDVSDGDVAWKQFKLMFTFNQERKAQGELEIARMRLAQANAAAKNNNIERAEKALEAHNRIMERVQARINNLDGASDVEGLNASATRLVGLERAIQVHERRVAYLANALENANLTEEQKARIESRIQNMEKSTEVLTQVQERKMEQVKTRLMAVGNMDEEEAEALIEQKQEQIRENVKERIQNRIDSSEEDSQSGNQAGQQ